MALSSASQVMTPTTPSFTSPLSLWKLRTAASVARPVKELRGFQRIHLKAGEQRRVTFCIDREQLQYLNAQGEPVLESGTFDIMIGGNSDDTLSQTVRVQ